MTDVAGLLRTPGRDTVEPKAKPLLEFTNRPGGLSRAALREFWAFRGVLWAFASRQVKIKYKQAAIGIGWAVFQPLVSSLLFTLFLGHLVRIPSEHVPYLVFALVGMVSWSYFSSAAGSAMESLVSDQAIIRKVYFPREVLPLASIVATIVDFVAGLGIVLVVAWLYGIPPHVSWIAVPLPFLILAASAAGLGLGISGLNVYYRDVRYLVPFVLQLALFATPVVYPLSKVPAAWRTWYAIAYPPAAAIDGMRRIVAHGTWPPLGTTFAALAWSVVLAAVAFGIFKRLERGFADRI